MQEKVTIWSSVIVAQLPETFTCQHKREAATVMKYKRIEAFKTRVSARQVKIEGKSAEVKVNVETLTILEDEQGNLHPFSRRDIITERVPLVQLYPRLDEYEDLSFIAEIIDFCGDVVLQGQNLTIIYYLKYMLLATRQQMVTLQTESMPKDQSSTATLAQANHVQNEALLAENIYLRRQLKIYETNLLSLKKSLQKSENINAELSRQVKILQAYTDKITPKKEDRIKPSNQKLETARIIPINVLEERRQKMGRKIKEFFINNA